MTKVGPQQQINYINKQSAIKSVADKFQFVVSCDELFQSCFKAVHCLLHSHAEDADEQSGGGVLEGNKVGCFVLICSVTYAQSLL